MDVLIDSLVRSIWFAIFSISLAHSPYALFWAAASCAVSIANAIAPIPAIAPTTGSAVGPIVDVITFPIARKDSLVLSIVVINPLAKLRADNARNPVVRADAMTANPGDASNIPAAAENIAVKALPIMDASPLIISSHLISRSIVPMVSPIRYQLVILIAVEMDSIIPRANVLNVFAARRGLNVLKKLFIPSAIEMPKLCQLNVVPNEFRNSNAVLRHPAMVFPSEANSWGENRPLRKCARPSPKSRAFAYTRSQLIFSIILERTSAMWSPRSKRLSMLDM